MLETDSYHCPYCGERVETTVDISAGDQVYIEDCQVCCKPVVMILQVHDDEWMLDVRREDDA
ncbi:CPXCG motif-containing cysteine-rich protein [Pseudomonas kermanshahensis]|uniref:CPXCG motif-containing cysteine-rich protein n=1 Tax=Pseudomonas kermanshahensis TaxID=2745482 RepID=A0ABU8RA57_9PSED|nr:MULTISPECIES: CPXCG motif-containing cysteine-rich protein [Pseudomonas]MBC3487714.1 CPXCG motif-containing cysteine-rich protein [Pseudomonas sp. SWRI50]MBC3497794.1 CPXCG motif-containing cysteine-rich protein [Pseudomonas sp. SWRI67]MBV4524874.1 CPXCG motif-containing cysteine-rich protein [Pseudomonas kermanshahensis]